MNENLQARVEWVHSIEELELKEADQLEVESALQTRLDWLNTERVSLLPLAACGDKPAAERLAEVDAELTARQEAIDAERKERSSLRAELVTALRSEYDRAELNALEAWVGWQDELEAAKAGREAFEVLRAAVIPLQHGLLAMGLKDVSGVVIPTGDARSAVEARLLELRANPKQ